MRKWLILLFLLLFATPLYGQYFVQTISSTPTGFVNLQTRHNAFVYFNITLTANVTVSFIDIGVAGARLDFNICEDATGGHTWSWPPNFQNTPAIATGSNTCSPSAFLTTDGFTWNYISATGNGLIGVGPPAIMQSTIAASCSSIAGRDTLQAGCPNGPQISINGGALAAIGAISSGTTAPGGSCSAGQLYFNTTTNVLYYCNGGAWAINAQVPFTALSASATLTATQNNVLATAGAAGITLTLPTAVGIGGTSYLIKRADSGAGNVLINTTSAQTCDGVINGSTCFSLVSQGQFVLLTSDNTNWRIANASTQKLDASRFCTTLAGPDKTCVQNAVNAVPAVGGTVILPDANINIDTSVSNINICPSGVTGIIRIIGSGPQSKLTQVGTSPNGMFDCLGTAGASSTFTDDVPIGATSVNLAAIPSGVSAGSWVELIDARDNTQYANRELAKVDSVVGNLVFFVASLDGTSINNTIEIATAGITCTGGTATANTGISGTAYPHYAKVGDVVTISGNTQYNGDRTVASVPAYNQFTFAVTCSGTGTGGLVTPKNNGSSSTALSPGNTAFSRNSSGLVTVTVNASALAVGAYVRIKGVTPATFDGLHRVQSISGTTNFTYQQSCTGFTGGTCVVETSTAVPASAVQPLTRTLSMAYRGNIAGTTAIGANPGVLGDTVCTTAPCGTLTKINTRTFELEDFNLAEGTPSTLNGNQMLNLKYVVNSKVKKVRFTNLQNPNNSAGQAIFGAKVAYTDFVENWFDGAQTGTLNNADWAINIGGAAHVHADYNQVLNGSGLGIGNRSHHFAESFNEIVGQFNQPLGDHGTGDHHFICVGNHVNGISLSPFGTGVGQGILVGNQGPLINDGDGDATLVGNIITNYGPCGICINSSRTSPLAGAGDINNVNVIGGVLDNPVINESGTSAPVLVNQVRGGIVADVHVVGMPFGLPAFQFLQDDLIQAHDNVAQKIFDSSVTGDTGMLIQDVTNSGFHDNTVQGFSTGFDIEASGVGTTDTVQFRSNKAPGTTGTGAGICYGGGPGAGCPAAAGAATNITNLMDQDNFNDSPTALGTGSIQRLFSTTFANIGTASNGSTVYCSDCTIANPCASGGTGAIAKRLNGVWVCN